MQLTKNERTFLSTFTEIARKVFGLTGNCDQERQGQTAEKIGC